MITGIDGFACTVKPKRNLNGATARLPAAPVALAPGPDVLGAQAARATAPAERSALRRVSRSCPMYLSSHPFPPVDDASSHPMYRRGGHAFGRRLLTARPGAPSSSRAGG